jgi:hypothetical protein
MGALALPFVTQALLSAAVPSVVSAVALDADNVEVTFSQPVTWDGLGAGTFVVGITAMIWVSQSSASSIICNDGGGALMGPGQAWSWSASDSSLSPVPNPAGTGVTT